jgi:hypothetical protein
MSLIEQLGRSYANEWLRGALLLYDGKPHMFAGIDGNSTVLLQPLVGDAYIENYTLVPQEYFESWEQLSYPKLGYRQRLEDSFLGFYYRRPSVRRGCHASDVVVQAHSASLRIEAKLGYLGAPNKTSRWHQVIEEYKARAILVPEYTPFSVGLPQVMSGKLPFFCMSADFAVAPSNMHPGLDILFRRTVFGTIDAEGSVSVQLQNAAIRELWEQESNSV